MIPVPGRDNAGEASSFIKQAQGSLAEATDLSEVFLDQIGACSMVLCILFRANIRDNLNVLGLFNFLLDAKRFEITSQNTAQSVLMATATFVVKDKVSAHDISYDQRGMFMLGFWVPLFLWPGLGIADTSCSTPFSSRQLKAWETKYLVAE